MKSRTRYLDLARQAMWVTIQVGGPALAAALGIGLLISLLQALTQVQEATLSFVPKALGVFATLALTLPLAMAVLRTFTEGLYARIAALGRGLSGVARSVGGCPTLRRDRLGQPVIRLDLAACPASSRSRHLRPGRRGAHGHARAWRAAGAAAPPPRPRPRHQLPPRLARAEPAPPVPTAADLAALITGSVFGLAIGTSARLTFAAMNVAGWILATQSGLAAATFLDPSEAAQSPAPANFLSLAAWPCSCDDGRHLCSGARPSSARPPLGAALPFGDLGSSHPPPRTALSAGLAMAARYFWPASGRSGAGRPRPPGPVAQFLRRPAAAAGTRLRPVDVGVARSSRRPAHARGGRPLARAGG